MSTPRHVLVTGGAGFIGSHLVERLIGQGCSVTVIDDCSTGSLANLNGLAGTKRLKVLQQKVSDCPHLLDLVAQSVAVYHLAAAVGVELVVHSPIRTIETNLHETETLLEAAAQHGTPVLITSTSEVYGKSQKAAFDEEDDLIIGPTSLQKIIELTAAAA